MFGVEDYVFGVKDCSRPNEWIQVATVVGEGKKNGHYET
jgi:hypothetical protein